jgi:hypothetical protein
MVEVGLALRPGSDANDVFTFWTEVVPLLLSMGREDGKVSV